MNTGLGGKRRWVSAAILLLFAAIFWVAFALLQRNHPSQKSHISDTIQQVVAHPVAFATNNFKGGIGIAFGVDAVSNLPIVHGVIPGSPAEAAGLRKGDVIVKINDVPTKGKALIQVVEELRGFTIGSVNLVFERDGTNLNCVVSRASWNELRELGHFQ
jgi:S1-C subfamily serine protease